MKRIFKHLTFTDRLKIEQLLKAGASKAEIAAKLRIHISTVYRELARGIYEHLNSDYTTEIRYSPDIAEDRYRANLKAKGADLKIANDHALAAHIENKIINEHYSPAAVIGEIKREGLAFLTIICCSTIYNYISKGVFLKLTNQHLVIKGSRKQTYNNVRPARAPRGVSIEQRPIEVNLREIFGHWEMDCVEGKKKSKRTLLVLTERKTRQEIAFLMKDQTTASVKKCLDTLERQLGPMFKKVFQSITVDNGSEFSDYEGMKRSIYGSEDRTEIYYCHPYSSWERGSNENQNHMIRRFFPKGTDFRKVTITSVQNVIEWLNNYPRLMFGYHTSQELYSECMASIK